MLSDSLLNTKEAARFLRVSEASIRRWSDAGLLPASRVGRRRERRFAHDELGRFLGHADLSVPRAARPRAGQPCFLVAHGDALDRYARALENDQAIDFDAAVRGGQLGILDGPGVNVAEAIDNWERLLGNALANS